MLAPPAVLCASWDRLPLPAQPSAPATEAPTIRPPLAPRTQASTASAVAPAFAPHDLPALAPMAIPAAVCTFNALNSPPRSSSGSVCAKAAPAEEESSSEGTETSALSASTSSEDEVEGPLQQPCELPQGIPAATAMEVAAADATSAAAAAGMPPPPQTLAPEEAPKQHVPRTMRPLWAGPPPVLHWHAPWHMPHGYRGAPPPPPHGAPPPPPPMHRSVGSSALITLPLLQAASRPTVLITAIPPSCQDATICALAAATASPARRLF